MKLFISHSGKDAELAIQFKNFLERSSIDIRAFCSSANDIPHSSDYVKYIDDMLDDCDYFVPILSTNYVKSKYCLIELGYAYSALVHKKTNWIKPFILPDGKNALVDTPLSRIWYYELLSSDHMRRFMNALMDDGISVINISDNIIDFEEKVHASYLKTANLFLDSELIGCCADPGIKDAVICSMSNDNSFTLNYQFRDISSNEWPDFISAVFRFYNSINLFNYYSSDNNIKLHFDVDNYTDSLTALQIEFQTSFNRVVGQPYVIKLHTRETHVEIPISVYGMYSRDLQEINSICFVIKKDSFKENEGSIMIKNISIE